MFNWQLSCLLLINASYAYTWCEMAPGQLFPADESSSSGRLTSRKRVVTAPASVEQCLHWPLEVQ